MKKFVYIIGAVIAVLTIAIVYLSSTEKKVVATPGEEVIAKFENNESFLLVIGLTTCSACIDYKESTLVDYIKEDREFPLVFTYSNKSFYDSEDFAEFTEKYGIVYNASPTTYLVKNGKVVNSIEGYIKDIDDLEAFIAQNK